MESRELTDRTEQRILGRRGLIYLLAYLSAFTPFSTDLYLPALPGMAESFDAPMSQVNMTIIAFFFFFGIGTLFWGPLSDKYGRKPILLVGVGLYTAASVLSAFAVDIHQLIVFRIFQAMGSGAVAAVAIAIIKDTYSGRRRESILAVVQSMMLLAPIIAPVPGAIILQWTSWRGVFWVMTGLGVAGFLGALTITETLRTRQTGTIVESLGRLGVVIKNPSFAILLPVFSVMGIPMMAYVAGSSYVFIEHFGLTEMQFSYFFVMNAVFCPVGPLLYVLLSRRFERNLLILVSFIMIIISGVLILCLGTVSPWLLISSIIPTTIFGGMVRPPGTNLLLEQQKEDAGSASSLIGFCGIICGSIGMLLISLDWNNLVPVLGVLTLCTGLVSIILWLAVASRLEQVKSYLTVD
ncbi:MAG: multidrug effflux MFS transporter [Deltaproteobacteria bacterium]|nr:multidrug effflux MFS transporter [Candidatus Zymogenaceae bacterium]